MKAKDIAIMAILVAIMAVTTMLPYVFILPLAVGSILLGTKKSFLLSLFFGLISMAYAFFLPISFVGLAFVQNPWLPVVARIFVGPAVSLVYRLICKKNKPIAVISASVTACVVNTACVLLLMLAIAGRLQNVNGQTFFLVLPELFVSFAIETAVAAAVVFPILLGLDRARKTEFALNLKSKQNQAQIAENEKADDICS